MCSQREKKEATVSHIKRLETPTHEGKHKSAGPEVYYAGKTEVTHTDGCKYTR